MKNNDLLKSLHIFINCTLAKEVNVLVKLIMSQYNF